MVRVAKAWSGQIDSAKASRVQQARASGGVRGADQLEIASCVDRASLGTGSGFFDDKVRVVKVVKGNSCFKKF